jgi:hypothetical protein
VVTATVVLLGMVAATPAGATSGRAAPDAAAAISTDPAARPSPDPIAHDPTIIKQGRYYYEIITGDIGTRTYLPIRRSTDLVHWTFLGTVFATPPAWVIEELGITPGDFWAPDINYFDGAYHLYYAASSFGTNNSVIGLATNVTLDPGSPDYRWVDRGMVIRSHTTDDFNAIDADVVFDHGVPWLSFGSFWDGIKMRRLDVGTGMLSAADTTLYSIASRGGASIEGPSIVRRGPYYYLFVSLDFCCRGVNSDYRVVVGRSTSVTGPYVDRAGVPMLAGGGTELLRGHNGFRGPGGGDVYRARHGDLYAHHYYDAADGGRPKGSVRQISWADGWPRLGDPLSGNRGFGHGSAYVTVVNRNSGAVVANAGCGYEGADIRLAVRAPGDACQQWRLEDRGGGQVSILNRHSNKVAEVAACVNTDGARVAQWGWLDNDCQRFRVPATDNGWSRIENMLAGRVLDVAFCGGPGTAVRLFTWLDNACQQFRLDPVGEVLISDAENRRLLGASACGRGGAAAVTGGRRTGDCQLWRFVPVDEGYFAVVHRPTGRPLTTAGRSAGGADLPVVLGRRGLDTPGAQWRIEPLDTGAYRLVNREGRAMRLDRGRVYAGTAANPGQQARLLTP